MSAVIATIFGIGYLRPAPGTWGSLFALFLAILLLEFFGIMGFVFALLSVGVFGWWATSEYLKQTTTKDPSEVVIDELVGIWIALMPAIYFTETQSERMIIAILALILFRVFDIFKPFPINYFDQRFKNGFGIVIDDVVAGIITLLILIPLSLLLF